ncbi:MAG: FtsX-like permease family protein, partial [Oscillospiraceae bacterium]
VYIEALTLSAVGIPLGLILGFLCGAVLTPVVIARLNGVENTVSASPVIFIGAALFALVTVLISCMKPARTAGKVSPVEAVRYTEGGGKKAVRKAKGGASLPAMALANLGRNRSKTAVTIASMSLSVVLLCVTFIFTNGFDMDKYLADRALADYITADAAYFQAGSISWEQLPEDAVQYIISQNDISDGGRTYGLTSAAYEFVTEDWLRQRLLQWNDEENVNLFVENKEKQDGLLQDNVQLYGMESFCLDKLNVFEGDISKLDDGNYIAAVYHSDDYGNIEEGSNWAKLGDKVKLRFVDETEYYDVETGEIYPSADAIPETALWSSRTKSYRDVEYEVAALVNIPNTLSYRYYGTDQFVLGADNFKNNTRTEDILYYAFDVTDGSEEQTDRFMSQLTQNIMPTLDYESKATYEAEFESFRSMFVIMGGALSFITGLVGVLNFLNAVLTGILTRRHEFAVLQSVGMTGKQLKTMLVFEGLFYAWGAALSALALSVVFSPLTAKALESMFWFFSYKFTVMPILI